ncbi:MAG: elongator complex protein 3 [Desulfohalobiaceae bacterium]
MKDAHHAAKQRVFFHPEPGGVSRRIYPVFLPFLGCPKRCIYCDQNAQTGSRQTLTDIFDTLLAQLERFRDTHSFGWEIGFFGGTFTALPGNWSRRFVDLASSFKSCGVVSAIRCSTRPDALDPVQLEELAHAGLDLVEVGVQSFDSRVLELSDRGYDEAKAVAGCRSVVEAGLGLGIQLLPGLPGHDPRSWHQDILQVLALAPDCVRIYPCLVLQGTPLARAWKEGSYVPWSLDRTIEALVPGVRSLWKQGIPVVRMGLPPEPGLVKNILAGPWHPALGGMVKSRILLEDVSGHCGTLGPGPKQLFHPRRHQGELWGHRGELKARYAALGLPPERVRPWEHPGFLLSRTSSQ